MLVNLLTIILKGSENMSGLMEEYMKENGKEIKCMEKGQLYGLMVENI